MLPAVVETQQQVQFVPHMMFCPLPPAPVLLQAPPAPLPPIHILANQALPKSSQPLFFDGLGFVPCPDKFMLTNAQGELVCPQGYSFVSMSIPSSSKPAPTEQGFLDPPSPQRSRSSSIGSDASSRGIDEKKPNKKFRHRSKQVRILEVHDKLKEEYTAKGIYASDDEVLRGFDTVRVHVKTFHALNKIQSPLQEVENHPAVHVKKIATPFSMKNRFQKKGFIVYLKLEHPHMVPIVQEIFAKYSEYFNKCDVALKKEDKIMQDRRNQASNGLALNFGSELPSIVKQSSVQAQAA